MRVYDEFMSKNIDELADWLDKYGDFDLSLWSKWWDKNYCSKCEPVITDKPTAYWDAEYAWCELNGKCKYFQHMKDVPDNKQVIKMWLESECQCDE